MMGALLKGLGLGLFLLFLAWLLSPPDLVKKPRRIFVNGEPYVAHEQATSRKS